MIERNNKEYIAKASNPEVNTFRESRVGGDCRVPERDNNIGTELADLRELVTQAHEVFSVLEDRTRAFRQPAPQCCEKEGMPIGNGSEIRSILSDQNVRLRALVSRIAVMSDEIDL